MTGFFLALCLLSCGELFAQKFVWQPSPGHTQIRIWPDGKMPDVRVLKELEFALTSGPDSLVAGKPATEIDNVSRPTMTVYSVLAIDLEGTEVFGQSF